MATRGRTYRITAAGRMAWESQDSSLPPEYRRILWQIETEPLGKPPSETDVLMVDDDPDALALADLRMTLAGYSVRRADSVNALLHSLLDYGNPDLLLLDVLLPDGDGFDVLAKMRRHHTYCLMPIVMLTGLDKPADVRRGLLLGADGYVTKPYSKNILVDTVRRVLKQNEPAS